MTIETLFPNGDDNGWPTGDWTDIDESIASADGNNLETSIDDDVVVIDLDDSAIVDGDTVNTVTVKIRAKDTGSGGKNQIEVDVDVGGGGLGAIKSASLSNSYATFTFTNALWDLDHTAAQMDAMQLIIRADQTGMGTAADWQIDAIDVEIDYTPAGGGGSTPYYYSMINALQGNG